MALTEWFTKYTLIPSKPCDLQRKYNLTMKGNHIIMDAQTYTMIPKQCTAKEYCRMFRFLNNLHHIEYPRNVAVYSQIWAVHTCKQTLASVLEYYRFKHPSEKKNGVICTPPPHNMNITLIKTLINPPVGYLILLTDHGVRWIRKLLLKMCTELYFISFALSAAPASSFCLGCCPNDSGCTVAIETRFSDTGFSPQPSRFVLLKQPNTLLPTRIISLCTKVHKSTQ